MLFYNVQFLIRIWKGTVALGSKLGLLDNLTHVHGTYHNGSRPWLVRLLQNEKNLKILPFNYFSEDFLSSPCMLCVVLVVVDFGVIIGSSLCLLESFASLLLLQAILAALAHFAAGWVAKLEGWGVNWGSDSF